MRTYTVITVHPASDCRDDGKPDGYLWQYDYGQRVCFGGVDLPPAYEVHFSNTRGGESLTVIGDITGADIPDELLLTGQDIHVWLYLHQGETDGETVKYARIAVRQRAKPTHETPTPVQQDEITQAIAALGSAVDHVDGIAEAMPGEIRDALQEAKDSGEFDGPPGPRGEKGDKGDKGDTGATGAQGPQGETGPRGEKGDKGDKGDKGATGSQGPQGETGPQGEKGDKGDTGAKGDKGDTGATGTQGPQGEKGDKGDQGEPGDPTQLIDDTAGAGDVTKVWSASKSAGEVSSLKSAIDSKAPVILRDASGDIVTISDGADGMPLKECAVSVDPVQDLHGYDNPWPAGGGANQLNYDSWKTVGLTRATAVWENNGVSLTATGDNAYTNNNNFPESAKIPVVSGETYTLSWDETTNASGEVYVFPNGGTTGQGYANNSSKKYITITVSEGITWVSFRFGVSTSGATISYKNIQFTKGSTVPAWTPYSNICPISGWTGAKVRISKFIGSNSEKGKYIDSSGNVQPSTGADAVILRLSDYISVAGGESYVLSASKNGATGNTISVAWFSAVGAFIERSGTYTPAASETSYDFTVTAPSNAKLCRINFFTNDLSSVTFVPSDHTATYPITFPDSAGTVYGGYVDPVNGELVVNKKHFTFTTANSVSNHISGNKYWMLTSEAGSINTNESNRALFKSNTFKIATGVNPGNCYITNNGNTIVVVPYEEQQLIENVTDANAWLSENPVEACVPLAAPITYPLSDLPTILTLPGYNAIWADTGAISLTYPADTKTYVDDHTPVQDVQVNGTSILSNGVANVPKGASGVLGVCKPGGLGVSINANGELVLSKATSDQVKAGTSQYIAIVPYNQHESVFYGLAKVAGNSDQSSSANAVGTYTADALVKIQKMLGIYQAPWELIREDTFTNAEEANHEITVDGNGNPFELTDVIYLFETPKLATSAEVADYGKTYFYYDSTNMIQIAMGAYTQAANSSAHGAYAKITCEDGIVTFEYAAQSTSGSGSNIRRIYRENFSDVYNISNFSISKIVICKVTGTAHYKIYGKRKWT